MDKKGKESRGLCEIVEIFQSHFSAEESRGLLGLEEEVDYDARKFKLEQLQEKIAKLERGYEGTVRVCPRCNRKSQYCKGDCARRLRLDGGVLSVKRAYYVCCECEESSDPLAERLGLVKGQEQGRLREKRALLAVLMPYNQAPYICDVLLSTKVHAENLRRLLARESGGYQGANAAGEPTLQVSAADTVYLEIEAICVRPERREKRRPIWRITNPACSMEPTSGRACSLAPGLLRALANGLPRDASKGVACGGIFPRQIDSFSSAAPSSTGRGRIIGAHNEN